VALLRDGLKQASGREAVPLLLSVGRRSPLASRVPEVIDAIVPQLKSASPAIRDVAARTLGALLAAVGPASGTERLRGEAAKALAATLADSGPDLAARIAVIDALGAAGGPAIESAPAGAAWLATRERPSTFAEEAARLRVLGQLPAAVGKDEVDRSYADLRLDAPTEVQEAAGQALGRINPERAVEQIATRLDHKDAAGLDVSLEIGLLGGLPREIATPALLKAWELSLTAQERLAFARACSSVADARLTSAASSLLDPLQWQTRAYALEALRRINTEEAARALWPHLDEEMDVARKLRLIAFLGRHGYRDGYAQALEYLSQPALREEAVTAIAAIGEPRAVSEIRRIWQNSNDLAWNAAAIRALARLGQHDIAPRLLEIARTPGEPLADSALIGLGDLHSVEALPVVREALNSRREEVVVAAAWAAASLLGGPAKVRDDAILDRLAAILADADASPNMRLAALRSLSAIAPDNSRFNHALDAVTRDANLENTPLLAEAERLLASRPPLTH
jgi:hypothetical protein